MRWFTDEAHHDDVAWEAALSAYAAHLAHIGPGLPADLRALASEARFDLHDARFVTVVVNRKVRTVEMLLAMPDGRRGLRLTFGEAAFVEENLRAIAQAVGGLFATQHWGSTRTTVMNQEIDQADDGRFVLRLRLYPFHELGLEFRWFSCVEETSPPDTGQPGAFLFADEGDLD